MLLKLTNWLVVDPNRIASIVVERTGGVRVVKIRMATGHCHTLSSTFANVDEVLSKIAGAVSSGRAAR